VCCGGGWGDGGEGGEQVGGGVLGVEDGVCECCVSLVAPFSIIMVLLSFGPFGLTFFGRLTSVFFMWEVLADTFLG